MQRTTERRTETFEIYRHKHLTGARLFGVVWVLLLGSLIFLWNLGNYGLVDETEPLFAEAARGMLTTGDWVTPYFNGNTRFDKPPLIYWLMAIAYQIFGVNEWMVRLPSALSAIAVMGMLFYTLLRFSNTARRSLRCWWLAPVLGTAIFALQPLTIAWGRTGVSDMLLTACMGLALLSFFCGYAETESTYQPGRTAIATQPVTSGLGRSFLPSGWYLASYLFTALAVLTKGPVGVVLPMLIVGSFLIFVGKFRSVLQEMRIGLGALIILAITLPWYILVTLANGEKFINSFIGYHNVERFTRVVNSHGAPWYFYFLVVLAGMAPWSVYLPVAFARLRFWQRKLWMRQPRSAQLGLFALVWFVAVFGFFTVAVTKLPSYVLPLGPAVAILVALLWESVVVEGERLPGLKLSVIFNSLLFLAIASAFIWLPGQLRLDTEQIKLLAQLQNADLLLKGTVITLGAAALCGLLPSVRQIRWIWLVNLLGFLALHGAVILPAMLIVDGQRQLPLRQLSAAVVQTVEPGESIVMVGNCMPSVVFYTQRPVEFICQPKNFPDFLKNRGTEPKRLLVLGYEDLLLQLDMQPYRQQTIQKAAPYLLLQLTPPQQARAMPDHSSESQGSRITNELQPNA